MRTLFLFLTCLISSSLFAEKFADIEYHLPDYAKNWPISRIDFPSNPPMNQEENITYLNVPSPPYPKEMFVLAITRGETGNLEDPKVIENLKKRMENMYREKFPNSIVQFTALEESAHSLLYEFKVGQDQEEKMAGWTRFFTDQGNLISAYYYITPVNEIDKIKPLWLETLKNIKVVQRNEGEKKKD